VSAAIFFAVAVVLGVAHFVKSRAPESARRWVGEWRMKTNTRLW
jgi:hypothetical protein